MWKPLPSLPVHSPAAPRARLLVTGATGFLGRHLCGALSDSYVLRGTGRRQAPVPGMMEWCQLPGLETRPDWSGAVQGMDLVVHLAARVHRGGEVGSSLDAAYLRENADVTADLARAAATAGARHLVFASSLAVHGSDSGLGAITEISPFAPDLPYARAKLEAERQLRVIAEESGMAITVLRPPLIYGQGAPGNFSRLVAAVARGLPLPFGSVANRRSLLFVGNFVASVCRVLRDPASGFAAYVLADGETVSTPELVRLIATGLGRRPVLVPCPVALLEWAGRVTGRQRTVRQLTGNLVVDASAFAREFGWHPPYTLYQGLELSVRPAQVG